MKLIGKPETFNANNPRIATFHRIALGLETDTKIYLSQLPRQDLDKEDNDTAQPHSEILLTTFDPEQWADLWCVSVELEEGEGVVAEVLDLLQSVNIGIIETLTTESRRSHEIIAIFDASAYKDQTDKSKADRVEDEGCSLSGLEGRLRAELQNKRAILKQPTISRLNRLYGAYRRFSLTKIPPVTAYIKQGRIEFDAEEFKQLLFPKALPTVPFNLPQRVIMYSDTEEKYLSMYFPKAQDVLLNISITHWERSGAILAFSKKLREMKVNILSSYSRLQRTGDRAQWKATLEVSSVNKCSEIMESLANVAQFFRHFDEFEVSYLSQRNAERKKTFPVQPYKYTSGLDNEDMFIGRQECIQNILNAGRENFLISGYSKTGKTCLLDKLEFVLEREESSILPVKTRASKSSFWADILEDAYTCFCKRTKNEELNQRFSERLRNTELQGEKDIVAHFNALIGEISKAGFSRMIVLLDEAQDVLSLPRDDELHRVWVRIIEQVREISWVVTSNDHWRGKLDPSTPLIAKLRLELLEPLNDQAASDLVSKPFDKVGVKVDSRAIQKIKRLTNFQACYIQALCISIYEELSQAPDQIDVVTVGMVNRALGKTLGRLQDHFSQVIGNLRELFEPTAFNRLLREDTLITIAEVRKKDFDPNRIQFSVIPGVVDPKVAKATDTNAIYRGTDMNDSYQRGFGWKIRLNEMLRLWLKDKIRDEALNYDDN
jgi:hypothetical protein